jgi:hypothetical protein
LGSHLLDERRVPSGQPVHAIRASGSNARACHWAPRVAHTYLDLRAAHARQLDLVRPLVSAQQRHLCEMR